MEITLQLYVEDEPSEESKGLMELIGRCKPKYPIEIVQGDNDSFEAWKCVCENRADPKAPYLVYYYGCESSVVGVTSISGAEDILAYLRDEGFIPAQD